LPPLFPQGASIEFYSSARSIYLRVHGQDRDGLGHSHVQVGNQEMRATTQAAAHVLRAAPRTFAALMLLLGTTSAAADDLNTYCLPDQAPTYSFGFADLKAVVGDVVGDPITCQYEDPDGNDILQQTTTGTLLWRASAGISIFTSGDDHWAMTLAGPFSWSGPDTDPPAELLAQA